MTKRSKTRNIRRLLAAVLVAVMLCPSTFLSTAYAMELDDGQDGFDPDVTIVTVDMAQDTAIPDSESEQETPAGSITSNPEDDVLNNETDAADDVSDDTSDAALPDDSTEDVTTDADDVTDSAEIPDETETETDSSDGTASDTWTSIADTKRPEATEDVTFDKGTADDKIEIPGDKDWSIFYDADEDVYKVTFNIGADANGLQVVDLTKALELLGQYAETGKQELQDAIDALDKPVKGDAGEAPEMGDAGDAPAMPEAPAGFDMPVPEAPEVPVEPGKPENLEENLDSAYTGIIETVPRDEEGEPAENFDYAGAIADATGLDKNDPYVKSMASYMYDQAMVDWCMSMWDQWKAEGHFYASYFGDPDTFLFYGCGITVSWPDGYNKGTPVLKETMPEFEVDKTSDAYKEYEAAKSEYEANLAQYVLDKAAYDAALDAWMTEHADELADYEAAVAEYEALKAEYDAKVAELRAEYEAAVADYEAKLAEIEAKYANDQAAYDAAVAALKSEFDRRIGANVLEPGDVKKFELFITSDSKHTYKYINGSFTLATPDMEAFYAQLGVTPDGTVTGFDGQLLGGRDVVSVDAAITYMSNPMMALFEQAGLSRNDVSFFQHSVDFKKILNGWYDFVTDEQLDTVHALLGVEKNPSNEELRDAVLQWVIDYYSTDGRTYESLEDLVANNPLARTELSSNNASDLIGGSALSVSITGGYNYDNFYQALFGFAFGDEENGVVGITNPDGTPATFEQFLGGMKFNEMTNRWEYGNCSWTDNGYQNALYYYMDHQEIWQQTDAYFSALLDGGLTAEQATWASMMMVLNIDGRLAGNNWQDTEWPWYSSIQLEQMDIDFSLTKKDGETGETITSSETEFQIYYIDKVVNEDGTETRVNMYCTAVTEEDGSVSYTFVTTPSTVWTENGELNISYAMMKDIVYYLQEITAPDGYELDTNVYIVMSEEDYNKLSAEEIAELEGTFDKFLDMAVSEDGLSVSTDFVNVKIVTPPETPETPEEPETPPEDPEDPPETPDTPEDPETPPETPDTPDDPDVPDEDIPDDDVPLVPEPVVDIPNTPDETIDIPDDDVPLTDIPDDDVPTTDVPDETIDIPDDDIPLSDIPQTGDEFNSVFWMALMALSVCGMAGICLIPGKKHSDEQ